MGFFEFNRDYGSPQALLMPFGEMFNGFETHLKKLKTFDDLGLKDWIKKALNAEVEFKIDLEKDDKDEQIRKESLQRW